MRLVVFELITADRERIGEWEVPVVDVTAEELETASMAWQAYRAPTPEGLLRPAWHGLERLADAKAGVARPARRAAFRATGLGATEMRLLELIARGYSHPRMRSSICETLRQNRVFSEFEIGFSARGARARAETRCGGRRRGTAHLERENYRARDEAYRRSRLSLTEFGKAILAHKEDFSRHNPIDRWWGGTRLTNDRMWRFDPVLTKP